MATQPNDTDENPEQARQRAAALWHQEMDLPEVMVRRICRVLRPSMPVGDLIAAGQEGLFHAATRFDPERGVRFRTYASIRVQGAILDLLRRATPYSRVDYARLKAMEAATGVSAGTADFFYRRQLTEADSHDEEAYLGEHLAQVTTAMAIAIAAPAGPEPSVPWSESVCAGDPEEAVTRAELVTTVQRAMKHLAPDESEIVRLRYFEGASWTEAAIKLNTTRSWAIRLHARAMARLTKYMRADE